MEETTPEHVDVLIVGAGLSGIGAACHLREKAPTKTFAILEARGAMGGTWDLFRYPGVRSDSDMFTLGFSFRPWTEAKSVADGPSIRTYIIDTARDYGVDRSIRYHHRAVRAEWSSEHGHWTVEAYRGDIGETVRMTCSFLYACAGYYDSDEGYSPAFEGRDRFEGPIIHPQHWPEDLDYTGKRVVVIGSGATAVTLIPSMVDTAAHVTMLQRSPSYLMWLPSMDPVADLLRRVLPAKLAHSLVRGKNVAEVMALFQLSRRRPGLVKSYLRRYVKAKLPDGYDVDKHFAPDYNPWDQRMCFVPDGDFFKAIRSGRSSIVTDQIETFTETGIKLVSGDELAADIIVTATGLNLRLIGGMTLAVDGTDVDLSTTVSYKGAMLSGIPNMALATGYTNASWTLKCDLVSEYVCRLLNHMDRHGYQVAMPLAPASSDLRPLVDLTSGYVMRSIDSWPKQGSTVPWRLHQNYPRDILLMRRGRLEDEGIRFTKALASSPRADTSVAG